MLPDIQPGNTKILYFFNCLLDGMHTKALFEGVPLPAANQKLIFLAVFAPLIAIYRTNQRFH